MIDFEKGKISNISKLILNSFNRLPADINENLKVGILDIENFLG